MPSLVISSPWYEIRIEENLPSKIERVDDNRLYLYIIINSSNQNEIRGWLIDNKKYNLVITLPDLNEEILDSIIEYKAIYDSTHEFIEQYLNLDWMLKVEIKEGRTDLVDKYKKVLLDDIMYRIRDKLGEAYTSLHQAIANMLNKAYWYSPKNIVEPINISIKVQKFEKPYIHYEKAKEEIKDAADKHIRSFIEDYMSQLTKLLNFYYTPKNELIDSIEEYVVKCTDEKGEAELSSDMNVLDLKPSQYFIVTPKALESVIKTIYERLKSNKNIQVSLTDNTLRVKRKEKQNYHLHRHHLHLRPQME
jgi:hypothetical protein